MTDIQKGVMAFEILEELMKLDVNTVIDVRDIIIAFSDAEKRLMGKGRGYGN